MYINEHAISFAAFSLAKILAAELLRKGILDRSELISAISAEVESQGRLDAARNQDTATLLTVYLDELSGASATR